MLKQTRLSPRKSWRNETVQRLPRTPGADGMQPAFLKEGADEMKEPSADIFRKPVRTRELLMGWREVNAAPMALSIAGSSPGMELGQFPRAGMCQQELLPWQHHGWQQMGRSRGCFRVIKKCFCRKGQELCPSRVCLLLRKSCSWSFQTLPLGITKQLTHGCSAEESGFPQQWQLGPGTGSLGQRGVREMQTET